MTELRDPQPPVSARPAAGGPNDDPLHSLYRMSRTAGLGSGDYVAINNTAIVALILGCASVLSLLYPIMLVAAAAAVVCGILAFVQIRNSNGTQSGRAFALLGILLGVALGGVAAGKMVAADIEKRRDENAIGTLIEQLSQRIAAGDYSGAYNELFTAEFKQVFAQQAFADRWESFKPVYGEVKKIDWGKRAAIEPVPATQEKRAVISSSVTFAKFEDPANQSMNFIMKDGRWLIDGIGQLFERPREARDPASAQPDPSRPLGPELMVPDGSGSQGPAAPDQQPQPQ